jgi:hypothetical protein
MARPRKANHIKEAQGTLQPCRIIKGHVDFDKLSRIPRIPATIPKHGQGYFIHCCEALKSVGLLSAAILPDIERAATWYHVYCIARNYIKRSGYYQKTKTGYIAVSPHLNALEKSQKALVDFETRNGLNIVGSQKLEMPKGKDETDKDFDE